MLLYVIHNNSPKIKHVFEVKRVTKHRLLPAGKMVKTGTMMAKMGTVGMLRLGHQAQLPLKIYKVGKRWPLWPKAKATSWKPGFLSIQFTVDPKSTWIWVFHWKKWTWDMHKRMQSEGIWHVEIHVGQCDKPGWNLTTMPPCGHTRGRTRVLTCNMSVFWLGLHDSTWNEGISAQNAFCRWWTDWLS